ncbi:hypothetical protein B0J15DRAFT_596456 [Fusarium solani]|uniref:SET domain-containing protein n=1 Tax=Fusarium solani TaxID=169388 RepID=A0A9P9K504_FUSSL|nr:uncharacterized protein B0J15DRAFT_596456 [Fusarium solani]KAH7249597.1 hypothetical protein B0J15DRAFT_596456 [Fusarium solani]
MSLDLERVDELLGKAQCLVKSLASLRPTLETPNGLIRNELAITLHDLTVVARDTLHLTSDLSSLANSIVTSRPSSSDHSQDLSPTPPTSISSVSSTLSKEIDTPVQTSAIVDAPTPPHTDLAHVANINAAPALGIALGPRKRLPSSAGISDSNVEYELGANKRHCQGDEQVSEDDHLSRNTASSNYMPMDVRKLIYKIKNRDKLSRIPTFSIADPPTTVMLRRVAAVQGGPAIRQFCSLIHTRRSRETEMGLLRIHTSGLERALELTRTLRVLTGRTAVSTFITRLVQFHIAEAVDDTKAGRLRADGEQIKQAMNKFGWGEAERPRFFQYLRQGRSWRSICGQYVGLLSLIPLKAEQPYGVSAKDFLSMKGSELDTFLHMIDNPFVARLTDAASAFQDMVMGSREDAEFIWEKNQPELYKWHGHLPETDVLSLVQPQASCEECLFDKKDFVDAPNPPGWPEDWAWPAHPLLIPSSHKQCDFCDGDGNCSCRQTRVGAACRPQVKSFGKQGIGLQAIALHEGDLACRKGDVLGQLTGRLVPADTHPHNSLWIVEMRRLDIRGDPIVCQIDVGGVASTFRNLNHSCRSSARMIPRRASGRWIMAVEATRDIRHGEQITINFGKAFLRNQGLRCECEGCQVPS